ncbi:hypothetical protein ACJX0J_019152, partial [Zea mays]
CLHALVPPVISSDKNMINFPSNILTFLQIFGRRILDKYNMDIVIDEDEKILCLLGRLIVHLIKFLFSPWHMHKFTKEGLRPRLFLNGASYHIFAENLTKVSIVFYSKPFLTNVHFGEMEILMLFLVQIPTAINYIDQLREHIEKMLKIRKTVHLILLIVQRIWRSTVPSNKFNLIDLNNQI